MAEVIWEMIRIVNDKTKAIEFHLFNKCLAFYYMSRTGSEDYMIISIGFQDKCFFLVILNNTVGILFTNSVIEN